MNPQPASARTLGAIATVVSAFVVFVVGGGLVLVSWVAAQEEARGIENVAMEASVPVVLVPPEEVQEASPKPEVQEKPRPRPKRAAKVKRTRDVVPATPTPPPPVEPPVSAAQPVDVPAAPPPAPVNPNGRGTVIIIGDAARVRLIGGRGTFGAGKLPSGSYTIQATFDGEDPRMAGTVEIGDGERVRIVCVASLRRCERR